MASAISSGERGVRRRGPGASGKVTVVTAISVGWAEDCEGDEGRGSVISFGEGKDPGRDVDNLIGAGRGKSSFPSACRDIVFHRELHRISLCILTILNLDQRPRPQPHIWTRPYYVHTHIVGLCRNAKRRASAATKGPSRPRRCSRDSGAWCRDWALRTGNRD